MVALEGRRQESYDGMSDYQSNDDCDFISNSDSNNEGVDINRFMCGKEFEIQDGRKVSLEVGILFENLTEFREALRDYVIQEGFEIVRDKNEKTQGVVEAINKIIPEATHRVCGRHLYNNFKKKFPGLNLMNHFWVAARAYNSTVFNFTMNKMKRDKKEAYEWLMEKPLHSWSRHEFGPRVKLMGRIHRRYEKACAWESLVTPKVRCKLDVIKQDSRMCVVVFAGGEEYEVMEGVTRFVVNLHAKSCVCRVWEIFGLPCKHAAACIVRKRPNLEEYRDEYYSKETYLRAHGGIIHPIFDENMWLLGNHEPIEPPPLRRLPGRPKKNRRRELDEPAPRE
ncbi:hypothetical protein HHK36_020382 [Tetracentron sinense]|uniref:SWIM-type domain-containing protein n=1 Tax=Tetracentron sinense TaxID=13715 RepID=A0A834YTY4_TETSI|nr:hypothetical protein HHK36_020382 [Tetracentron sinense]